MLDRLEQLGSHVVGREAELAVVAGFLGGEAVARALVVDGEAGIGKTTLWEAGVALARAEGRCVLTARAGEVEARLPFAALADLLEGIELAGLDGVPGPQLRALEVALCRADPTDAAAEPFAISSGFLNVLRALAGRGPLLLAVDDVPWLDRSSADVLVFAARRLRGRSVRFLLARRPGERSDLEQAFAASERERLPVGPLSLGATRSLLLQRLGLSMPRRVLRQVFEASQGNPLFVLELGRLLAERGTPGIGAELPVPDSIADLFRERVDGLAPPVVRALLAASLSSGLARTELVAIVGPEAAEGALASEVLVADGGSVRPSHPLLAEAARRRASAAERRELHAALARGVGDETLHARHLALAAETADAELARTIALAAARAGLRGAANDAVELAEHALRLTPDSADGRSERLLALGEYLLAANEAPRATALLAEHLEQLQPGAARVHAYGLLADASTDAWEMERWVDLALAGSEEPALRATALARKAGLLAVVRVERIAEAEAAALEATRLAGPAAEAFVPYAYAWTRILGGHAIDDLRDGFPRETGSLLAYERLAGIRLAFQGRQPEARAIFERLSVADDLAGGTSYATLQIQLCELHLRAGDSHAASRVLDQWERPATTGDADRLRCEALLAACRGKPDDAERAASSAIAEAEATGVRWNLLEASRARGIAALLRHEPQRAAESLGLVWSHTRREGIHDPGAFPVAPDLVEALAELGELDEARAVSERLRRLAERQEHPWGLASAKRCQGLLVLATGVYDESAAALLVEAADAYGALELRFDQARSLLALGRAQRRFKKWAAARHSLEQSAAIFDGQGSIGWADEARAEMARVGARRPKPEGLLTDTEQRIARLATDGLSNKEIAATLYVSVHTVEKHLSHVYAKLGIRSRGQLAQRLPVP